MRQPHLVRADVDALLADNPEASTIAVSRQLLEAIAETLPQSSPLADFFAAVEVVEKRHKPTKSATARALAEAYVKSVLYGGVDQKDAWREIADQLTDPSARVLFSKACGKALIAEAEFLAEIAASLVGGARRDAAATPPRVDGAVVPQEDIKRIAERIKQLVEPTRGAGQTARRQKFAEAFLSRLEMLLKQ